MGIRQPSKTRAFLAQATAGAQKQQKAREELKKPALGGSAQAGTAMVTAGTQQQQAATQNLVTTGQQAAKDLTFGNNVGSSTQTFIGGTATTPAATTPATTPTTTTTPTATATTYTGGVSEKYQPPTTIDINPALQGNSYETSQNTIKQLNDQINSISNNIEELDKALKTASDTDRAAIQAEIDRLKKELQRYQDMITKENLGQIAGPSTFETEMMKTQKLLAGDGGVDGDVGKLAALFGGRKRKFGALESQIYGKDLEMLQEAAGEALRERGLAEQAADVAEEEYQETLKKSQKGYEEKSADASKKVEILNKTPDEFAKGNFTRADMEKLFGTGGIVDRLFEFDANNKVTKSKYSSTRETLVGSKDTISKDVDKVTGDLKAKQQKHVDQMINSLNDSIFGPIESVTGERRGGSLPRLEDAINTVSSTYNTSLKNMSDADYSGVSRDKWYMKEIIKDTNDYKTAINNLATKLRQAQKDNNLPELQNAQREIANLWSQYSIKVSKNIQNLSRNGRRFVQSPTALTNYGVK